MKAMQQVFALVVGAASSQCVQARPFQTVAIRTLPARVTEAHEAVFAIPVVTVVVAVQPGYYYSYRAAVPSPPPVVSRTPPSAEALEVPTAESVLRQHCSRCHSGTAPRGGVSFFAEDDSLLPLLPRRAILEMASPSADAPAPMPPGEATKLNDAELQLLRDWAEPPRDLKY